MINDKSLDANELTDPDPKKAQEQGRKKGNYQHAKLTSNQTV
jgi:hypothetical protein